MIHDAAHCLDCNVYCPSSCYRKQLVDDLLKSCPNIYTTWSSFRHTKECPLNNEFNEGDYIIYHNGDKYELGKIKRLTDDGAFVWYHSGSTAAKTAYVDMHKLTNAHVISETSLGGE